MIDSSSIKPGNIYKWIHDDWHKIVYLILSVKRISDDHVIADVYQIFNKRPCVISGARLYYANYDELK